MLSQERYWRALLGPSLWTKPLLRCFVLGLGHIALPSCWTLLRNRSHWILRFNSSTSTFGVALIAKKSMNKTVDWESWNLKENEVSLMSKLFMHLGSCLIVCCLSFTYKINAVMSLSVDRLGFASWDLVSAPSIVLPGRKMKLILRDWFCSFCIQRSEVKRCQHKYTVCSFGLLVLEGLWNP